MAKYFYLKGSCLTDHTLHNNSNTFFGFETAALAHLENTTGNEGWRNSLFGYRPGYYLTTGYENTYMGYQAGLSATTAHQCTAIGANSQSINSTGNENTSLGALSCGGVPGDGNTAIGYYALRCPSGSGYAYNIAIGDKTLSACIGGTGNIAIGGQSGDGITNGGSNIIIGPTSGRNISTGSNNILIGAGLSGLDGTSSNYISIADAIKFTDYTTGDMRLTHGGVTIQTVGKGLNVKEGTNARMGQSVFSSGTVTITTTAVTANSRIFLTRAIAIGTALGGLTVGTITAGTSFVVSAVKADGTTETADGSYFNWIIMEPA